MAQNIDTRVFEGLRLSVYKCTSGKRTIGYGHNLETSKSKRNCASLGLDHAGLISGRVKLTKPQAEQLFQLDYADAAKDAASLMPNFYSQPRLVQDILTDLSFNMGKGGLAKFKNTLKAFERKDYKAAARGLELSLYYKQTKSRAKAIVAALRSI